MQNILRHPSEWTPEKNDLIHMLGEVFYILSIKWAVEKFVRLSGLLFNINIIISFSIANG